MISENSSGKFRSKIVFPSLKTPLSEMTDNPTGKKSFQQIPFPKRVNNGFRGSGIMAPVKNIRINNGNCPAITKIVAFLQKLTTINATPIIPIKATKQITITELAEPTLLNPNKVANA